MNTSSLPLIERASLRTHVYGHLLRAIITGDLAPGSRVRDQDLAEQLGVSRTPVREALQRLEDEGLVETRRGSLTRIMPLGNVTQITEQERAVLAAWVKAGAKMEP